MARGLAGDQSGPLPEVVELVRRRDPRSSPTPSNGYSAGFPVDWISRNGRDLWLKWAANFDGCAAHLNCTGGYGFNYERMHLTLAGPRPKR